MQVKDLEVVAAIEGQSFRDPWPMQSFKTELLQNSLASYYVARLDDQVIAYIGAWVILDEVHITTLAVAEPYRRSGIASHLVAIIAGQARRSGSQCLTLEVRPSNSGAISFYQKLGFSVMGRRRHYYNDEDALIMTWLILDGESDDSERE